ncbi:early nodulin-like protein 6 [Salvia miltiorrhiza]|uniref:early nodulin-like protein 6 n=1 Tax=Salvia miltiorrhiza TaxID=226208 RepID=UPI0025AC7616|nr:early nodulin-like protein 6 [Salvia miltiorrhiza]
MASSLSFPLTLLVISMLCIHAVECVELDVGGDNGWATPSSKNQLFYNDWASKNRFNVNDTLRFAYKKDSVMVVTEEEYEKCRSSHPVFFANNGDTAFVLERPGLFYFISGVATHCQRGLKMIVKVLEPESPPQTAAPAEKSAAVSAVFAAAEFVFLAAASLLGVVFM